MRLSHNGANCPTACNQHALERAACYLQVEGILASRQEVTTGMVKA